jgi:Asp-tRNA(Asn)/Glu-tRNA(Gln) amidotransferase A subunit family amidase
VPNGFTDGGLPTGIQFVGKAYDENAILAVARAYQSVTGWHKLHPPGL